MDRRTLLRVVGVGIATGTAGCMGGEVVHDVQQQVRIDPGRYWVSRLPSVGDSGAISYIVRGQQRFDVYVFTDPDAYNRYEAYHQNGQIADPPTGDPELSATAVGVEAGDGFATRTTDEGARQSFDTDAESYFVVDHSAYGMGADPGDSAGPLRITVDLEVVDERLF